MPNALTSTAELPTDPKTGLTLPLSKSLGSQDLGKHRAMVAVELEVMAKKMDRFGWERDRGSMAHDRLISDWMEALQDYPLGEVQEACRVWVSSNPRKMPNEGDILKEIRKLRAAQWEARKATLPPEPEAPRQKMTKEEAQNVLQALGCRVNEFGGVVSLGGDA